jgi:membrane protein implicated in regulation of membrane protease activity
MDILGSIPPWVWLVLFGGGGTAILVFVPGALALVVSIFNALPRPVKLAGAAVLAIAAAFVVGRRQGKVLHDEQQKKNDAKATETRLEVDREVGNMTEKQRHDRLEKYYRD